MSNIISRKLDRRLEKASEQVGCKYARYADDITVSGNKIPSNFLDLVDNIVSSEGFELKKEKTVFVGEGSKKIVTGISISGNRLQIPRKMRREIKLEIFLLQKNGVFNCIASLREKDPLYLERLLGRVSFWLQVDRDNVHANKCLDILQNIRSSIARDSV